MHYNLYISYTNSVQKVETVKVWLMLIERQRDSEREREGEGEGEIEVDR